MVSLRACFVCLVTIFLAIGDVCCVSIAAMPVTTPALALTETAAASATAGVIVGEAARAAVSLGESVFLLLRGEVTVPSSYKPLFTVLGAIPVVVGADAAASSWDCWKPILHEASIAPSRGRLLTDLLNDPVINDFSIGNNSIFVRNRWNESWRIDPVVLPWGQLAAHATPSDHLAGLSL
eukprot:TRINITY_DN4554_c0_g1_i2.p1 TRINITY_DN4554_c0_g1~~TRINITY_DN4554_c0_g1_i2.p1  ORF type:complete len:196 (-),score=22.70 TRINITY_DN4554_c0_g1_i2:221-760(-)